MSRVSDLAGIGEGPRDAPTFSPGSPFDANRDGFDLIFRQGQLQNQMLEIENDIREIEPYTNLSDTEKMFSMQMAMNAWSAITNLRSNMLKNVSDSLKTIARNVA